MKKFFGYQDKEDQPPQKLCDSPDCDEGGLFRAPKCRGQVGSNIHKDFHWFCLEHIREYNKKWNYFQGMSHEDALRETHWSRPTWPMGRWSLKSQAFERLNQGVYADPFNIFSSPQGGYSRSPLSHPNETEAKALALLGIGYPYTAEEIRAKYLVLVKKFHPDANGGSPETEEKIKRVNEAYAYLKEKLKL